MRTILLMLTGFLIASKLFAQDVIITTKGEEIYARVLQVDNSHIMYRKPDTSITDIFAIEKSSVLMIRYQNGTKDIFRRANNSFTEDSSYNEPGLRAMPLEMQKSGTKDAKLYYDNYKACARGTFFATLYGLVVEGLIPACACTSTAPKEQNLGYHSDQLMKNPDYSVAYRIEAYRIKRKKTWTAFGVAAGVEVAVAGILVAVIANSLSHFNFIPLGFLVGKECRARSKIGTSFTDFLFF